VQQGRKVRRKKKIAYNILPKSTGRIQKECSQCLLVKETYTCLTTITELLTALFLPPHALSSSPGQPE
jgi:hypothetical protein